MTEFPNFLWIYENSCNFLVIRNWNSSHRLLFLVSNYFEISNSWKLELILVHAYVAHCDWSTASVKRSSLRIEYDYREKYLFIFFTRFFTEKHKFRSCWIETRKLWNTRIIDWFEYFITRFERVSLSRKASKNVKRLNICLRKFSRRYKLPRHT